LILAGLAGLAAVMVAISWRKWPDPLIDFGRELYMPWRISQGAVFGRDFMHPHGPLASHLNAVVFWLAGPGIMKLVAVNLAVYAVILVTAYSLLKRGWGRAGAALGCAVFVVVFSFSKFTAIGNYNYATPYSHEAVHGLLCCLGLAWALLRWRETGSPRMAALAGLLLGATVVLKVDCLMAAVLVTAAAVGLHVWERRAFGGRSLVCFFAAVAVPTLFFTVFFARHLPWLDAFKTADQAVFNVLRDTRYTTDKCQLTFLGLDEPWLHLRQHIVATVLVALIGAVIMGGARLAEREIVSTFGWRWLGWGLGAILAAAAAFLGWSTALAEPGAGYALLGLTAIATGVAGWDWLGCRRRGVSQTAAHARLLLGVLGAAMMLRMALNGRFNHYGFYQAAVAGMVVTATLFADWPARAAGGRRGRLIATAVVFALVAAWAGRLAVRSSSAYGWQTYPVGRDSDRMFFQPPDSMSVAGVVGTAAEFAARNIGPAEKLLVLPEGLTVNYLARRQAPPGPDSYFAAYLKDGSEAAYVRQFMRAPPEWVLVISRDLREHGVDRYGESPGHGELLLRWVRANYTEAAAIGGDPLDVNQRGARFFKLGQPGRNATGTPNR
jgi:hypothetical protein